MSIDSMFVHKMWEDDELSKMVEGGIPFPMLSDAGWQPGKPTLKPGIELVGNVWKKWKTSMAFD